MKNQFNVAWIRLSQQYVIEEYNQYFISLFRLNDLGKIKGLDFEQIAKSCGINPLFLTGIDKIACSDKRSFLVFQNYQPIGTADQHLLVLYVLIEKIGNQVVLRFTNWISWLHNINSSLNSNYLTVSQMDQTCDKSAIESISEAHCFKALYPLLAHIPVDFFGLISSSSYFNILRLFNKKRGEAFYSKDYNRDTLSRIKHALKKDFGITNLDITNIVKSDQLVNLKAHSEFLIMHTSLKSNINISPVCDLFLESFMKCYPNDSVSSSGKN